jgi:hypothetical protein
MLLSQFYRLSGSAESFRPIQQKKSGAGTEWFRTTTCIACHRLAPEQCINLNSLRLRIVTEVRFSETLSSDHLGYAVCQLLEMARFVGSGRDMAWCRPDLLHIAG